MKYEVIYSHCINEFYDLIEIKISNGWIFQGGIFVDNKGWYHQAMVKLGV